MTSRRPQHTSAFLAVTAASAVYVVAAFARRDGVSAALVQFDMGRSVDISLLYLIILLPGVIVGRLHPRHCVILGFAAGYCGEILYSLALLFTQISGLSGAPGSFPVATFIVKTLVHSVPHGILAAAGGALGAFSPDGGSAVKVEMGDGSVAPGKSPERGPEG